jgi:phage tail-like protein
MDVNGLPMWQIAGRRAFGLAEDSAGANIARDLDYRDDHDHVRLAERQAVPAPAEDENFARRMASAPSPIADPFGGFAWWDADTRTLNASGFRSGSIAIQLPDSDPPSALAPRDFAFGADDVIYATRDGAVLMTDVRERWSPSITRAAGFNAHLLAPAPKRGAWTFDATNRSLARVMGYPLRALALRDPQPEHFAREEPNPNPPRIRIKHRAAIPPEFDAVAMATSREGRLALLAWESGQDAAVFSLEGDRMVLRFRLAGLRFPYSLAWNDETTIAVLASDKGRPAGQAFVYSMDLPPVADQHVAPDGKVHPLIDPWNGKFCNATGDAARYLHIETNTSTPIAARALHALSGTRFARSGSVLVGPIDSQTAACVWHRLYVEAVLPSHGVIEIAAVATETRATPKPPGDPKAPDWAPHLLSAQTAKQEPDAAVASWCAASSEIPFSPPALSCEKRPGSAGLFTVLLQNPRRKVRRISGRFLWLHLTFKGDGRGSPELATIRAYAKRFSYRDHYLPAFYREQLGGSDADAPGQATPHDFMDRLLCLFEGVLTEMEGRIASSWLLTDPGASPNEVLPWIGQWIGVAPDRGTNAARFRQALLAAPMTAALNGTIGGLSAALEIATGGAVIRGGRLDRDGPAPPPGKPAIAHFDDVALRTLTLSMGLDGQVALLAGGAVTRGDIVIVEGFRLRRTFATILGADLADEHDPLTLGMAESGNSVVGDTLVLGDEARAELVALYRAEIDEGRRDAEAVEQFYSRLAHRVLVLIRGVADPAEMRRLTEVVEANIPAHVEPQVHEASDPLIIGAASLVGVDSYLAEAVPFRTARLEQTVLGRGDFVGRVGQLDRRAAGPVSTKPVARPEGPPEVWSGATFTLSATRSAAAGGRRMERYIWTWE